ncbi:ABC transporter permease [Ancylobacter terrae]|uniref:ABC transporter permease n=1 Tax=Ancylobacter sp. sgz301288 TaxID=3342077 RepID=UPI00385D0A93
METVTRSRRTRLAEHLATLWQLMVKELRSFRADPVMMVLVVYTFSVAVVTVASGASTEATNLAVGVVDEDQSVLSRRIRDAMGPPLFRETRAIEATAIDAEMDKGGLVFVVEIPPKFEADLLAGRTPSVQVNVDATAMTQAGNGAVYIQSIITSEVNAFLAGREGLASPPINVVVRVKFNPNLLSSWFTSVMQVINSITILGLILTGAALIREREQGTVEHLLVMPVVPAEIMLAKIAANGLVVLGASALSLTFVVGWWLGVPTGGPRAIALFLAGAALYSLAIGALGILLGTIAQSMGQFGLLAIPVMVVLQLLSGSTTPMESMPAWLRYTMLAGTPTPHFVAFAQGVLYRGAGLDVVWRDVAALSAIGAVYFALALRRFRRVIFGS